MTQEGRNGNRRQEPPSHPVSWELIKEELSSERRNDHLFGEAKILSSMYSEPLAEAKMAHELFASANLGNPGLVPGTDKLARDLIDWALTLWGGPMGAGGQITSGATESNILSLWAARHKARDEGRIVGNRRGVVLAGEHSHFSIHKACRSLDLDLELLPLDASRSIDMDALRTALSTTQGVVALAGVIGSTETGAVDDIKQMGELALTYGIPLHIDAAFSGFIQPFLRPKSNLSLSLPGVTSIAIDPHKFMRSTLPCGLVLSSEADWFDSLAVETPYLTSMNHHSLLSTRPSGAVAGAWAAWKIQGNEGIRREAEKCMTEARWLTSQFVDLGLSVVFEEPNFPIVVAAMPEPAPLIAAMKEKGWFLSRCSNPSGLRVVIMPHTRRDMLELFLTELKSLLKNGKYLI